MRLELNLEKRYVLVILVGLAVVAGAVLVVGSHTSGTPNPGHSISQIGGFLLAILTII